MSLSTRPVHQFPKKLQPLFSPKRYKILYGGRGGAKSWGIARALLIQGSEKRLRILCTREIQKTIADSVHKLLADQIVALGLTHFYTVQETTIRGLNGTEFLFAGIRGHDIAKIKSFEGVDICWVEEAQTVSGKSWEHLGPTIRKMRADGTDPEIWISFNPELDTDETYKRFVENPPDDSVLINVNWDDNPWFPEVLRKEKDALYRRDAEAAKHVWGGQCRAAVEGAIYAREMAALQTRVCNLPIDPLLKVHTIWDLGFNDSTAIILVQKNASEIRIVDYLEDSHRTLAEYANELKAKGHNWGCDYVPWDGGEARYQLTDVRTSPEGILKSLGRKVDVVPSVDVEVGIGKARLVFPRCYFDKEKTARLRECLKRYRRSVPVSTGEPARPLHDEFSHGADAFRYLAVIAEQLTNDDQVLPQDYYKAFRRNG